MEATVTELLREFPKVRQAALRGEKVIIRSREGDFQFSLLEEKSEVLVGSLAGCLVRSADDLDSAKTTSGEWRPSL